MYIWLFLSARLPCFIFPHSIYLITSCYLCMACLPKGKKLQDSRDAFRSLL